MFVLYKNDQLKLETQSICSPRDFKPFSLCSRSWICTACFSLKIQTGSQRRLCVWLPVLCWASWSRTCWSSDVRPEVAAQIWCADTKMLSWTSVTASHSRLVYGQKSKYSREITFKFTGQPSTLVRVWNVCVWCRLSLRWSVRCERSASR